jgi:CheY-like chemotaxis protein
MKAHVLLASTDKYLTETVRRFCASCGYEIDTALGGLECLTKLRRRPPAALVLDIELPWGGGDGVLAQLREDVNTRLVPVVLVSGAASFEPLSTRVIPPVVGFFQKPVPLAGLLTIAELLKTGSSGVA